MDSASLRNFRDFLLQYNKISENCFTHCISDLSSPQLTEPEVLCAEHCTFKHVKMNHRTMQIYVELQSSINQKRIDDANKQAIVEASKNNTDLESSNNLNVNDNNAEKANEVSAKVLEAT